LAENCIFCSIVAGTIPARMVHSDDDTIAFRDINPQAPTHVLVVPRRHIASVDAIAPGDAELIGKLLMAAAGIARAEGVSDAGYRLVVNNGAAAGQTVDHIHVHVLGGRQLAWPPG
jgi:histidine triad (HIT) family protein